MTDHPNRRQLLGAAAGAVAGTAVGAPPALAQSAAEIRNWDHEADIVVIGLGVAGGAAALEAARAGARVVVLDRGSAAVYESHGFSVYMGGGTPMQKSHGVEDTPEEMEKFLLASQSPEPDKERIRIFVERSLQHYQWLVDLGIDFSLDPADKCLIYSGGENVWPCTEMAKPAMRGHNHRTVPTGQWLQRTFVEKLRAANVPLLLAADAERLVQAADGRVVGIVASVDGKSQSFRARRGVILASGGFTRNRDMVAQHAPLYLDGTPIDVGANDGWGIRAGQALGADVKRMEGVCCFHVIAPPVSRLSGAMVNRFGQRFIAEEAYPGVMGYRIVREQGGVAFLIVDDEMLGRQRVLAMAGSHKVDAGRDIAASADTIAELEKKLRMPEGALQHTVETYNRFAAKQQDPYFHKNPDYLKPLTRRPFHAVTASVGGGPPFTYFTVGGLHANAKTEVLDTAGAPIAGLYGVGRVAAGILNYPHYLSGVSLGEGTMFGRIAGQTVAKLGAT